MALVHFLFVVLVHVIHGVLWYLVYNRPRDLVRIVDVPDESIVIVTVVLSNRGLRALGPAAAVVALQGMLRIRFISFSISFVPTVLRVVRVVVLSYFQKLRRTRDT